MPKVLTVFFSFFCLTSCYSQANARKDYSTNKKVPTNSFVKIIVTIDVLECKTKNGKKKPLSSVCKKGSYSSVGSGISIGTIQNTSIILTAGHICTQRVPNFVARHTVTLRATNLQYQTRKAIVINSKLDPITSSDICLLAVPGLITDSVKISQESPEIGQSVYSLSAPAGIVHPPVVPILHGIFSGDVRTGQTSIITIRATGGSSGSGVLNRDMELVGILFATHTSFNNITLMSSRRNMMQFMAESLPLLQEKLLVISDPSFKK